MGTHMGTHMTMTMTMTMTTHTITVTRMTTDASLLRLIWLASPALPVGGFSYSEGLEAAIDHGLVSDEASARDWIVDQLHTALSRGDLAVVAQSLDAWRSQDAVRTQQLNDWVLHTRETAELRQQTEQMGRSLVEWLRAVEPDAAQQAAPLATPTWPVAFALAASSSGAPLREVLLSCAFGWAENLVAAAIKAVPLGQNAGQRILRALAADIPAAVDHALSLSDDQRQAFSPMLAILSARHETQYSRLFRS
jgi:urease accessory protein